MVDRKTICDCKAQLEKAITDYELAEHYGTLISVDERSWLKGLTKAVIIIFEWILRRGT